MLLRDFITWGISKCSDKGLASLYSVSLVLHLVSENCDLFRLDKEEEIRGTDVI